LDEFEEGEDDTEDYLAVVEEEIVDDLQGNRDRKIKAQECQEPLRGIVVRCYLMLSL
jgi:hypothetical protein